MKKYLVLLMGVMAIAGCQAIPTESKNAGNDIDEQILSAAKKIELVQSELYQAGAINETRYVQPATVGDDSAKLSINWQGDVSQLIEQLASSRGIGFQTVGVRQPIPVSIDVKDMPFSKVLDRLRMQAGYRADITQADGVLIIKYNMPNT